jgi:tetratricopeptide (TPR) repeat protein
VRQRRAKPPILQPKPPAISAARLNGLICLALLIATFAVYSPVRHFDFVNYDDPDYITGNPHVRPGLTAQGFEWALTSRDAANWFPLTWVSHMLDCQLFGLESGWHHLDNVLLHALAAVLLCIFVQRATGTRWRGALVAFLFALHPLHVESVAWVAERKDVLSACFWFLTMWAYVRYTERPGVGRYLGVVAAFGLGLLTKPMVVTLPLVLLLLDFWPLGRLEQNRKLAIWEKVPLLALSLVAAAITYLVQERAGAVKALGLGIRIENALVSYCVYIVKTFWPARLAVFYPYPRDFPVAQVLGAGLLLAAITSGAILLRRRAPYLVTGWGWFLVNLVPVIGLVQVGGQARADRYMYLPMVGLSIMLVWGITELVERRRAKIPGIALAAALAIACFLLTGNQVETWQNSETLFRHALEVTEDNAVASHNLGSYLMASPKRLTEAIPYLEAALRIDPDSAPAHTDLGSALAKMPGRLPDAIGQFQAAVRLAPDAPIPHNNLGSALTEAGRLPEAIAEFETALRLDPSYGEARRNLAVAQASGAAEAHRSRGIALLQSGDPSGAIGEFEAALRIDPNDGEAHNHLGVALSRFPERQPESIAHFEAAVRLRPQDADAQYNLGVALSGIPGRLREALRHLEEAQRLKPDPELERAIARLRAERP